jgi:hypothetical protein
MFPSSTKSSTPVIVTVCGVLQFRFVKVSRAVETVPSAVLVLLMGMVTFPVG